MTINTTNLLTSDFAHISPLVDDVLTEIDRLSPSPGWSAVLILSLWAQILNAYCRKTCEALVAGETFAGDHYVDAMKSIAEMLAEADTERRQMEMLCYATGARQ